MFCKNCGECKCYTCAENECATRSCLVCTKYKYGQNEGCNTLVCARYKKKEDSKNVQV